MLLEKAKIEKVDGLITEAGRILRGLNLENKSEDEKAVYNFIKQTIEGLGYTTDPEFYEEYEDGGILKIDVEKETINRWLHLMSVNNLFLLAKQNENEKLFDGSWMEKAGDKIGEAYDLLLDSVLFRDCEDAEASRLRIQLIERGWFG